MFIRPHCPWQNGKVERYNRTLQTEWAYRQVFKSLVSHDSHTEHHGHPDWIVAGAYHLTRTRSRQFHSWVSAALPRTCPILEM
jgi:transposase InsO family protein